MSVEDEQGEWEQPMGLEEEPHGPQRTSSGLVSTQRSSKLKRVLSPGGADAARPGGAAMDNESLLTIAKREAARRILYSKFYRGEVLRGEYEATVVSTKGGGDEGKKRKREGGEDEGHEQKKKKKKKRKKKKQKNEEKEKENGNGQ